MEDKHEKYYYENGLESFCTYLNDGKNPLHKVLCFDASKDGVNVNVALQYTDSYSENLISFVNNVKTGDGGTHEVGFKTAITKVLNDYAKENNFIKGKDKSFEGSDVREGLTAIISVQIPEAILQFEGQTKSKLGTPVARSIVEAVTFEKLKFFLEENKTVATAIIQKALKKEDKDSYITNVRLNEDHTYTVTYASGREETSPFSIHNYQVELYRMENSFKEHGDEYVKRIWNNGPMRAYILGLLLVADGLYLSTIIKNGANVFNIIFLGLMLLQQVPRFIEFFVGLKKYLLAKKKVELYKTYLENKSQFSVPVKDSNGRDEEWYLVDLANIDQFENVKELNDYLLTLTPGIKEEQGISLTKKFSKQA